MLTEEEILKAPDDNYMDKEQLEFFEQRLRKMREEIEEHVESARQELSTQEREFDVVDQASAEEEQRMKLRMLDREAKLIPKIDAALKRIENGSYGYCLETGEPIGIPRLLARPTATLSIEAKDRQERAERLYGD